jgi:hypothetical protein
MTNGELSSGIIELDLNKGPGRCDCHTPKTPSHSLFSEKQQDEIRSRSILYNYKTERESLKLQKLKCPMAT